MIGRNTLIGGALVLAISLPVSAYAGPCDEYMKDAEAIEGVVPKFKENGKIKSFHLYGEATFIAATRSLIKKARRRAVLSAKREFAEWMKQKLSADTVVSDMLETVKKTDQDANVEAMAEEITQQVDNMRANASTVLSGIIKLDECVDPKAKVILVNVGWKPSMSKAAADAVTTINKEVQRGDKAVAERERAEREGASGGNAASGDRTSSSDSSSGSSRKAHTVKGYRKKSRLKDKF